MLNQKGGADHGYGPWPWVAGMIMGFAIIALMFALSTGFA